MLIFLHTFPRQHTQSPTKSTINIRKASFTVILVFFAAGYSESGSMRIFGSDAPETTADQLSEPRESTGD